MTLIDNEKNRQRAVKLDPSSVGELDNLRRQIAASVIGHKANIEVMIQAFIRYQAGMNNPKRPAGIFLCQGPTGSGKTHICTEFAKAALAISGAEVSQIAAAPARIDCAEYHSSHEVAKMIGSPPGYLGHRETQPVLSNARLKNQGEGVNFVLLDEIDKAHPNFFDLLLGVFDSGRLSCGDNSTIDFTRTIFMMTSNFGAREMQERISPSHGIARFAALRDETDEEPRPTVGNDTTRLKKILRPEFMNRIDAILTFGQLTRKEIMDIETIQLGEIESRLVSRGVGLSVSGAAREAILVDGYDALYGARHLKRSLQKNLEVPLANLIVSKQVKTGDIIGVTTGNGEAVLPLEFYKL